MGIGKYNSELAHFLSTNEHEVRVITAHPYYPTWKIMPGYSSFQYIKEYFNDGVSVYRCPIWVPSYPSGFKRIIHLISFALSSLPIVLMQALWRPSLVFVVEPTFFCTPAALLLAKLCRSKSWLHIQDFEVDAAFDMGLLGGYLSRTLILKVEFFILQLFDRVSTISQKMLKKVMEKGVKKERLYLFKNWVDLSKYSLVDPSFDKRNRNGGINRFREILNIPEGAIVALYSGNMGAKQGLSLIESAIRLHLKNSADQPFILHWVLCGNGPSRMALEEGFLNTAGVHFLDLQPESMFLELLDMADIHLLPQRADVADLVMPSKLTGMLASGKAVLATAHENTELEIVLKGIGVVVPPENPILFYNALVSLAKDPDKRVKLGLSGAAYAKSNLNSDSILRNFNAVISNL